MLALVSAGLSLAVAPLVTRDRGWALRGLVLVVLAVAAGLLVAALFPTCLNGPYGALSAYVRDNHLARVNQEKSLFARPDFVLSASFVSMAVLFVGAWRST